MAFISCLTSEISSLLAVTLKPSLIMRTRSSRVVWLWVCFTIGFECHGLREFVNQSESPPCLPRACRQTGQAGLLSYLLLRLRHVAVFRNQYPLHLTQPEFYNTLIMKKEHRIRRLDNRRVLRAFTTVDRFMALDTKHDIPDIIIVHLSLLNKNIPVVVEVPNLRTIHRSSHSPWDSYSFVNKSPFVDSPNSSLLRRSEVPLTI